MRKWIAVLSRDPEVLADFLAHLADLRTRKLHDFMDPKIDIATTRGAVEGLDDVRFAVTSAVNEEKQRARRPVAA